MITRRQFVITGSVALLSAATPGLVRADGERPEEKLARTKVVYLTAIKSNGEESQCQSEVWFVNEGSDIYVVTAADTWRARAVKKGLDRARIWVGDLGVWNRTGGQYRKLPSLDASATLVESVHRHDEVLAIFGGKYASEWNTWGPRFKDGLMDGARVMLKYATR